MKKRYEVGLEKLATTESSVADMQQELIALQPQLEVSTKETEAAMVVGYPSCTFSRNLLVPLCFVQFWGQARGACGVHVKLVGCSCRRISQSQCCQASACHASYK